MALVRVLGGVAFIAAPPRAAMNPLIEISATGLIGPEPRSSTAHSATLTHVQFRGTSAFEPNSD
jgi:hypothetical protein